MILVRSDLEFNLTSIKADDNGRYIIIEGEVESSKFLFVNIYAHNKIQEQCRFFDNLNEALDDFVKDKELRIVVGGDFNVTFNPGIDCCGGNPTQKESALKVLHDLRLDFDLVDIWRLRNPETKRFTWRQKNPFIQRRLDYWLISDVCQEEIDKADIIPSINSDHSAIILHFNSIDSQKHGLSFWKFRSGSYLALKPLSKHWKKIAVDVRPLRM